MLSGDLRAWIDHLDKTGGLERIHGADWNLEIGGLTGLLCRQGGGPVLLFDNIKDYPKGRRVLVNLLGALERFGMAVGLDYNGNKLDFVDAWRQKVRAVKLIPPREVRGAQFEQNTLYGKDIDLWSFPAPKWNELDGGRYLSTGGFYITKDPDSDWINIGTYRGMIMDRDAIGMVLEPGAHARAHRDKWFAKGKPCPVVVVPGADPLVFLTGALKLKEGVSEYDYAGGLRGEPIEVVRGEITGLPIPSSAEIVLEGELVQGDERPEGPFGEWTGYYASGTTQIQAVRVKKLMHRDDPIIFGHPPYKPPSSYTVWRTVLVSGGIWNDMEAAGVPGIKGVWAHEASGAHLFNVVCINQRYAGHSRQAALIAAQCSWAFLRGRYIVVVDDDVDPTNLEDVIWAMGTRSDPAKDVQILYETPGTFADPAFPRGHQGTDSRAIIDACKPFNAIKNFAPVCEASPELRARVRQKWPKLVKKYGK